ncbi:MAG: hypothetical protein ACFFAH_17495, partial [Promethearchaeota archaeon]
MVKTSTEYELQSTYIGKNKDLIFKISEELFSMNSGPIEVLDRESAKIFSKYLMGTFRGFKKARKTKYGNEKNIKTKTDPKFWETFEKKAKELEIDFIGYTPIIENFIFNNLKVYGKNGIILGMEMKWDGIMAAPSVKCEIEVFRVYKVLGEKTIELTEYLKSQGYKSEAHHPFGGKLLFGPHVVKSGLGIAGRNGLIITPEFGPRQRWSMITTDAVIPDCKKMNFKELENFCRSCGLCIKNCKGGAVYEEPIKKNSGIITHIDRSKCTQSILKNNYCS